MTRIQVLAALRVAGYHNDHKDWMRLYVSNPIDITIAQREWSIGEKLRIAGFACVCSECTLAKAAGV